MARNRAAKSSKANKLVRSDSAPPTFREAIAYMHGVADAVSVRAAPLADAVKAAPSPASAASAASLASPHAESTENRRPTLRYGEVPTHMPEAPVERRRTLPYGALEGATDRASQAYASAPPDIAFEDEVLERPSGIRLRCAPLREEWYELAGTDRRR